MLVTITNATSEKRYVSALYRDLNANGTTGDSVTVSRSTTDLQLERQLLIDVEAGDLTLAFAVEDGDSALAGSPGSLEVFANAAALPAAAARPLYTPVWQADNATIVWTDGTDWKLASGVTTS